MARQVGRAGRKIPSTRRRQWKVRGHCPKLDGPRTFQGNAVGDQIEFERNGIKESLRATNGAETGMKWLSEKSNCLTVRAGEGYCRE